MVYRHSTIETKVESSIVPGQYWASLWGMPQHTECHKRKKNLFSESNGSGGCLWQLPVENLSLKQHYLAITLPANDIEKGWRLPDDCCWMMLSSTQLLCLDFQSTWKLFSFYIKHCLKRDYNIIKLGSIIENVSGETGCLDYQRLHPVTSIFIWVWKHHLQMFQVAQEAKE